MYCGNCGKQIPDYSVFCPECGQPTGLEAARAQQSGAAAPKASREKNKKRRIPWPVFAGAGVLLAAIVVVVIVIAGKNAAYRDAAALFDAGEYAQAEDAYDELGGFSDSRGMAEVAHSCDTAVTLAGKGRYADALKEIEDVQGYPAVDALRADCEKGVIYQAAEALMDKGEYAAAKEKFLSVSGFSDAAEQAVTCHNAIDYEQAVVLLEGGDYDAARAIFDRMPDFRDAAELSLQCQYGVQYDQAASLLEQGIYEEALALFETLSDVSFRDAADMVTLCNNYIQYDEAKAAYQSGKYYTAYQGFSALGDFLDSASKAASCVQTAPKNGAVYTNPSFSNRNTKLKVDNSGSSNATYMKLYQGDTLVITIYVAAGKSATVSLPAGTYSFKRAYGSKWFGQEEMFGENGTYYVLKLNGASTYRLDGGYLYTLGTGQGGDPVDYDTASQNGF